MAIDMSQGKENVV